MGTLLVKAVITVKVGILITRINKIRKHVYSLVTKSPERFNKSSPQSIGLLLNIQQLEGVLNRSQSSGKLKI